jgi:MFS family permease
MAIMTTFGSHERDKYLGMAEAAGGLGLLVGPVAGAALYSIGGFAVPFIFFAVVLTLFSPIILCVLYNAN